MLEGVHVDGSHRTCVLKRIAHNWSTIKNINEEKKQGGEEKVKEKKMKNVNGRKKKFKTRETQIKQSKYQAHDGEMQPG